MSTTENKPRQFVILVFSLNPFQPFLLKIKKSKNYYKKKCVFKRIDRNTHNSCFRKTLGSQVIISVSCITIEPVVNIPINPIASRDPPNIIITFLCLPWWSKENTIPENILLEIININTVQYQYSPISIQ